MKSWDTKSKLDFFQKHPQGRELLIKYNKDDAALIRAFYVFPEAEEVLPPQTQFKWSSWHGKKV